MKQKKITYVFALCVCLALNASLFLVTHEINVRINSVFTDIEALSNREEWWEGKKLEIVNCECGKSHGHSFRCRKPGSYESCTATQQGLNGCYSVNLLPPSGKLLCEGEDVSFEGE